MRSVAIILLLSSVASLAATETDNAGPPLRSGIDMRYVDHSVRPQDDFFRYLSGKWLDSAEIPADRPRYGSFDALAVATEGQLRAIVDGLAQKGDLAPDSEERKIADLYDSFMDEESAGTRGLKALQDELARIDQLTDKHDLPALIARLAAIGVDLPIGLGINQDERDSSRYAVHLAQGGLGLPDRDYYLKDDDAKLKGMRDAYLAHVQRTLTIAGVTDAELAAARILGLETEIARSQWTKVENRDPVRLYNKTRISRLPSVVAGFDWNAYFAAAAIDGKVDYVIVQQPSYFAGFSKLLDSVPLPTWQEYFKWHLIASFAPYLDRALAEEHFDFYGKALRGIPEDRPRWKRGVELVEDAMGEALGRIYVGRHFPPRNKARMEALVGNLLSAYQQSISRLNWMSPATKRQALAKLAKFTPKIGYPKHWRDYTALTVDRADLVGNVMRGREFEFKHQVGKLGQAVDRDEWEMTPQTVNAYYNPALNEIVFPAAILQPPFFDMDADDAVNYGAIGAIIGHEISHGFDDEGSQFDGEGNLRNWWSKADHDKFKRRVQTLVAQYGGYSPIEGYKINGELTLGENIADNSGLPIAYKAYRIALGGRPAPVMDGLSGDQRFCLGFAQAWREKARDAEIVRLIQIDPHSPPRFRANGSLSNLPMFYSAFAVKPGDKMYLPPERRVRIW